MNSNPYQSPDSNDAAKAGLRATAAPRNSPLPLALLTGMATLTIVLAWIDAFQERVPGTLFVLQVTVGAVGAQLPGLLCAELHRRSRTRYSFIFLVTAFFIAVCSVSIYVLSVLAGQLQTSENTAQMHVVFIPFLLALLALVAYAVAGVAAGADVVLRSKAE